jgi:hypothetical protein
MRRRRLAWVIGLGAVGALGAGLAYWALSPAAPPRQLQTQNFPSVRAGMTQAEVERLLGGPPGKYGRYANGICGPPTAEGFLVPPGSVEKIWCDDANWFEIYFDAQGRVVARYKRAGYQQRPPEWPLAAWWRMLRRQLGL